MSVAAAAALGGAQLAGGIYGARESRRAAQEQANAAQYAANLANQQFQQTRADLAPWREEGAKALGTLGALSRGDVSSFYQDPSYQFRLAEGEKALNRAAAARGMWDSGATLKELSRYSGDLASTEFGNYWNRLAGLAGIGQTTGMGLGQLGAQSAGNVGNLLTSGAAASAAGRVGAANALTGTLGNLGGLGMQYYMWNNRPSWMPTAGGGGYLGEGSQAGVNPSTGLTY